MTARTSRLTLRVVVPDAPRRGATVEVRPLVDGADILAGAFPRGPAGEPRDLLRGESPLLAATEPHEVRLAEAGCTEGCCGALYVTVRRDDDQVVWSAWRNPAEAGPDLPEFRFDAREYQAEVERAVADHSWEWPAHTVARLLESRLRSRPDWPARWDCELEGVAAWVWEPERINLFLLHPGHSDMRTEGAWLQFRMVLDVSGDPPDEQAERLAERLLAGDPRQSAEVCGGSWEYARQLGYPWTRRRRGA
ncbi:hypothetical protein [Streptomyces sp. NPDC005438]|uniref:hypothetical protein n=1 Tax=Streptomyces sp. NPDC005438 TaxID=3156880 RepID=UPI0033A155B9